MLAGVYKGENGWCGVEACPGNSSIARVGDRGGGASQEGGGRLGVELLKVLSSGLRVRQGWRRRGKEQVAVRGEDSLDPADV